MPQTLKALRSRLLPSRQLEQLQLASQTYLAIPDDNLLHGFRKAAGMAAPGQSMGGWCGRDSGVIFGQIISGLCRLGATMGNAAATTKAIGLFDQWRQTAGPDGDARLGTYTWDKLMGALVDLDTEANYPAARTYAEQTVQWAAHHFDRTRTPASAIDWDGRQPHGTWEWYTLGENLYRAGRQWRDDAFGEFAQVWAYPAFWNKFAATSRPADAHSVHAYSHVNSLCSLAAAYESNGDQQLLHTLLNAADYILGTQCYATGGYGPWERLLPLTGQLGRSLDLCCDHAEVGCGSWAAFKLGTYLLRFTGDIRWADWIERVLYNLIGAALPVQVDGRTFYYTDYRPSGGMKLYFDSAWPCCSGSYLQALTAYHDLIYFTGSAGLHVVLYVPSEVRHGCPGGQTLTLRQESDFPASDVVTFRVRVERSAELPIRLRIPGWCAGATATVGTSKLTAKAGEWLEVGRRWNDGDVFTLHLPMRFSLEPVDAQHPNRCAVVYGPLVMAQEGRYHRPLQLSEGQDINLCVTATDRPLTFAIRDLVPHDLTSGTLRPLYEFPERTPYRVYHDLRTPFLY